MRFGKQCKFQFQIAEKLLRLRAQIVAGDQDFLVVDGRIPDFSGD